jgi:hypothetical protein
MVILNVGGTKFVTSKATLTVNSIYFTAQFSSLWDHHSGDDDEAQEYFLDQDPGPFQVLLSYMRKGFINIDDLADVDVLLLAEYLGIEKIISATKVTCFRNMHPSSMATEDVAFTKFHEEAGASIKDAVKAGVLPRYLLECKPRAREYAILRFHHGMGVVDAHGITTEDEHEETVTLPLLGCINWLSHYGYTQREEALSQKFHLGDELGFSRPPRALQHQDTTTDIFVPSKSGPTNGLPPKDKKTYLMLFTDRERNSVVLYAPEADEDIPVGNILGDLDLPNTQWCSGFNLLDNGTAGESYGGFILAWMNRKKYICRELELEHHFKKRVKEYLPFYYLNDTEASEANKEFKIFSKVLEE